MTFFFRYLRVMRLLVGLGLGLLGAIAIHAALVTVSPAAIGLTTDSRINTPSPTAQLAQVTDQRVSEIEQTWFDQYAGYFGSSQREIAGRSPVSADAVRETLDRLSAETRSNFALIYLFPHDQDLELVMVVPGHPTIRPETFDVPKFLLDQTLQEFRRQMTHPIFSGRDLASAQQLYRWIIAPLDPYLQQWNIDTLVFCVGEGLRSTPLAGLHDGQSFLMERYSIAMIPAFSLTDDRRDSVQQTSILAMGASEFQSLNALPAVPVELNAITQDRWQGDVFLNERFTQANLREHLGDRQYAIVHLATHAAFQAGEPEDSYIQLWENERIRLNELQELGWRDRPVELLVLSACQTAMGSPEAELGFAGLSFHSGVKSTLASLWQVNDLGTLALMREFYWQLSQPDVMTKAEALQRTQKALLQGQVYVEEGVMYGSGDRLLLPPNLQRPGTILFNRPYDWAGFTLVGSPW